MINILHLIETSGPGGAENVLINLSAGLDSIRFRSIVCLRKDGWLKDELERRHICTYVKKEKGFIDIGFIIKLLRLIIRERISLIHSHEFLMGFYGALLGKLAKIPVITTFHGKDYYWEKARRRLAMRFIANNCQLVTVSNEMRQFLSEKVGISVDLLKTINNGIDLKIYSERDNPAVIKKTIGIDKDTKVVGTVGSLYPVKGQTYLLRAVPLILNENPDVMFLFIGRGEQEKELRQEALNLNVSSRVRFLGFRSDVPALLDVVDVFVLPSLSECLPLSVLEAMAKKIPAVVTDVGGNREIIDDRVTGFIVPPANVDALADRISILLNNERMAEAIGRRASETVRQKFSLETMLLKYESMYDTILSLRK
jgi:glycosyltransferase involved in cell wall biosynthesis